MPFGLRGRNFAPLLAELTPAGKNRQPPSGAAQTPAPASSCRSGDRQKFWGSQRSASAAVSASIAPVSAMASSTCAARWRAASRLRIGL